MLLIRRCRKGQFTDEIWPNTLTDAQDAYCQSVRDGAVDFLEIRNADDELVFRYPLKTKAIDGAM